MQKAEEFPALRAKYSAFLSSPGPWCLSQEQLAKQRKQKTPGYGVGVSKSWAFRLGLCAAVAYLGAQALGGRQGLVSLMALKQQERALSAELASLRAENAALEARALALQGGAGEVRLAMVVQP